MKDALLDKSRSLIVIWIMVVNLCCSLDSEEQTYRKAQDYWDQKLFGLAAEAYEQFAYQFPDSEKADDSLHKAAIISSTYLQEYGRASDLYQKLLANYHLNN